MSIAARSNRSATGVVYIPHVDQNEKYASWRERQQGRS